MTCKDCETYRNNEAVLMEKIENITKERDRYYSFILGIKNMTEALPEFQWKD